MLIEATSVMLRLREETIEHHKAAESRPVERALAAGTLPKARYVALLGQRLLIHRRLESRVRELAARFPFVGTIVQETLFQEPNLRADLRFFGVDPDAVTPLTATSRFLNAIDALADENPLSLLGVYYVFEGSKNGARYIVRRLRPAYGLAEGPGTLYLDPHGEQQRPLWEMFKQRMDAAGFAPADQTAMVAAAKMAFDAIAEVDEEIGSL